MVADVQLLEKAPESLFFYIVNETITTKIIHWVDITLPIIVINPE